jgi:hypothetical protein
MRILKILIAIVIILVLIFFIGGMLLPKTYSVSRTKLINAPASTVYTNIADFNNFLKWNPWTKMEPSAKVEISGTPAQPGHLWKWKGEETGEGQMEIQKVQPYSEVDFILTFTTPYESSANNTFNLKPLGDKTEVTWTINGSGSSAMERWMYLNMDNMLGKDFESGLENLKNLSEGK